MSVKDECCFIGRGEAFISDASNCGWSFTWGLDWGGDTQTSKYIGRSVGNVTSLKIRPNFSQIQTVKRSGLSGGADCSAVSVDGYEFEMTFSCLSKKNLSESLYGNIAQKTCVSGPQQDCVSSSSDSGFECGSVITLKSPNFDDDSIVVTRLDTNAILVKDVDYTIENFGIKIINEFNNPNLVLQIDYTLTSDNFDCIEAFTDTPSKKRITFSGFNLADKKQCFFIELYKVKLTPLSELEFINEDFQTITVSGQLEPNPEIKGEGRSKYFRICYKNKG